MANPQFKLTLSHFKLALNSDQTLLAFSLLTKFHDKVTVLLEESHYERELFWTAMAESL